METCQFKSKYTVRNNVLHPVIDRLKDIIHYILGAPICQGALSLAMSPPLPDLWLRHWPAFLELAQEERRPPRGREHILAGDASPRACEPASRGVRGGAALSSLEATCSCPRCPSTELLRRLSANSRRIAGDWSGAVKHSYSGHIKPAGTDRPPGTHSWPVFTRTAAEPNFSECVPPRSGPAVVQANSACGKTGHVSGRKVIVGRRPGG